MNPAQTTHRTRAIAFIGLALLPIAYVASYFALPVLPPAVRLPRWISFSDTAIHSTYIEINGKWNRYPDYHGLPGWFFAPIHHYDRTHLRPGLWSGNHPRNEELAFDWLIPGKAGSPAPRTLQ